MSSRERRLASRVPRYHQIAQTLRERIVAEGQGPGQRLDTQRHLAREFGVTLMTLRQALDLLERDGLIARRHGLGTFVARQPEFASYRRSVVASRNQEFAAWSTPLDSGDEIAFLPPVSGG